MADERKLRYVVEIDTAKGKATLREFAEDAAEEVSKATDNKARQRKGRKVADGKKPESEDESLIEPLPENETSGEMDGDKLESLLGDMVNQIEAGLRFLERIDDTLKHLDAIVTDQMLEGIEADMIARTITDALKDGGTSGGGSTDQWLKDIFTSVHSIDTIAAKMERHADTAVRLLFLNGGRGGCQPPGSGGGSSSSGGGGRLTPQQASTAAGQTAQVLAAMSQSMKAGALAGAGAAAQGGMPGAAMGMVGAAVGGMPGMTMAVIGAAIDGIGAVAEQLISMSRDLSQYSGDLFASVTELDLAMMGFKIRIANELDDELSDLIDQAMIISRDMLPHLIPLLEATIKLTIEFLQLVAPLLPIIVDSLTAIANSIQVVKDFVDWFAGAGRVIMASPWAKLMTQWNHDTLAIGIREKQDDLTGRLEKGEIDTAQFDREWHRLESMFQQNRESLERAMNEIQKSRDIELDTLTREHMETISQSGTKLGESIERLFDSINDALGTAETEARRQGDDLASEGAELMTALFDTADKWAQGLIGKAQGMQLPPEGTDLKTAPRVDPNLLRRDIAPSLRFDPETHKPFLQRSGLPNDKSPVETFITKPDEERTRGMPRPSSAAIHFKMTDQIKIQEADAQMIHDEMMLLTNKVMDAVHNLQDMGYVRLASARARVSLDEY